MIHILDRQTEQVLDVLVNHTDSKIYWNTKMTEALDDNQLIFEFTTLADGPAAKYIVPKNKLTAQDQDGFHRLFSIESVEKVHDENGKTLIVTALGDHTELGTEQPIAPQTLAGQTPETAVQFVLAGTRYVPGQIDFADSQTITFDSYISPLAALNQIASIFGLELRFRVEVHNDGTISRVVDLLKPDSVFDGKEIVFGKDLLGIRRKENTDNICTRLIGIGPADANGNIVTFASVNGGKIYVEDDDAFQRWNNAGRHVWGVYEYQPESGTDVTPQELLDATKKEMQNRINSAVEWEVTDAALEQIPGLQHERVRVGMNIRIKDEAFDPAIYLEARVLETEMPELDDPNGNFSYTFGNYHEVTVVVPPEIKAIQKTLFRNANAWTAAKSLAAQALQDAAKAQATADGKITSFYQPDPPETASEGDLWFDTNDGNKPYIWQNGGWQPAQDSGIAEALNRANDAQATADKKVQTFFSDTAPTAEGIGDLWYNPASGTLFRWDGSGWLVVSDVTGMNTAADTAAVNGRPAGTVLVDIQSAQSTANTAQTAANNAQSAASAAQQAADQAQQTATIAMQTADGKNTNYYGPTAPPNPRPGDAWFVNDSSTGAVIAIRHWDGTQWVDDVNNQAIQDAIAQAQQETEEAKQQAQDAVDRANQAVQSANDAIQQAQQGFDAAQSALTTATNAQTMANDAATKAQQSFDAAQNALQSATASQNAISELQNEMDQKLDTAQYQADLENLQNAIAAKADAEWVNGQLVTKADKADTYTKTEVDNALNSKVSLTQYTADLNGVITRLDSAESRITQNEQEISTKVSNEQYQQDQSNLSSQISQINTQIQQQANQIALKADATDVYTKSQIDGQFTTVNTQISNLSAQLTVQADQIATKVSKTEFDALQIGGRNLLKNSNFAEGLAGWKNWGSANREIVDVNGKKFVHIWTDDTQKFRGIQQEDIPLERGAYYTISFTAYRTSIYTGGAYVLFHQYGDGDLSPQINQTFNLTEQPQRFTFTFQASTTDDFFRVMIGGQNSVPFDIYITDIKFEKGNRATDWTPAPEDYDAQFSSINQTIDSITTIVQDAQGDISALQQTTNSFATRISNAEGNISSLTQTVSGLQTSVSDIQGNVSTLTQTADSLQSRLTTAEGNISLLSQTTNGLVSLISQKADQSWVNSQISQLSDAINLRVQKNDVINQINVSTEGILIDGKKIHITGQTTIDNAVIKDAMIESVSASKISATSLSAISANLGNVTAGTITGVTINGSTITSNSTSNGTVTIQNGSVISQYDGGSGVIQKATISQAYLEVAQYPDGEETPNYSAGLDCTGVYMGVHNPGVVGHAEMRVDDTNGHCVIDSLNQIDIYNAVNVDGAIYANGFVYSDAYDANPTSGGTHVYVRPKSGGELRVTVSGTTDNFRPVRTNGVITGYTNLYLQATEVRAVSSDPSTWGNSHTYSIMRASSFANGSLAEYKQDIHVWEESALEKIRSATIYEYYLKSEVEQGIYRRRQGLVIGDGYNTPDGVIDGDGVEQYLMNSWSWKAIQELDADLAATVDRVSWLETENEYLKQKVTYLENKINELEAQIA